jgi:hypothetical protein
MSGEQRRATPEVDLSDRLDRVFELYDPFFRVPTLEVDGESWSAYPTLADGDNSKDSFMIYIKDAPLGVRQEGFFISNTPDAPTISKTHAVDRTSRRGDKVFYAVYPFRTNAWSTVTKPRDLDKVSGLVDATLEALEEAERSRATAQRPLGFQQLLPGVLKRMATRVRQNLGIAAAEASE